MGNEKKKKKLRAALPSEARRGDVMFAGEKAGRWRVIAYGPSIHGSVAHPGWGPHVLEPWNWLVDAVCMNCGRTSLMEATADPTAFFCPYCGEAL